MYTATREKTIVEITNFKKGQLQLSGNRNKHEKKRTTKGEIDKKISFPLPTISKEGKGATSIPHFNPFYRQLNDETPSQI